MVTVPDVVFDALPWAALATTASLGIVWRAFSVRSGVRRAALIFGMLLGVAAALWGDLLEAPIVIVRMPDPRDQSVPQGSQGPAAITRGHLILGGSYVFQDGHSASLEPARHKTVIVNDSPKPLRLELHYYGAVPPPRPPKPIPIASMSAYVADDGHIDDVGPDGDLPAAMWSPLPTSARSCLTWD